MRWSSQALAVAASCLLLPSVLGLNHFERIWERTTKARTARADVPVQAIAEGLEERATKMRFLTPKTKKFQVTSMPEVNYDIGEMYAGNIPIGTNASEALYFVFQPKLGAPTDQLTIWLNGGPGCSSLEGFFQENGRFLWQWGQFAPIENPYSWVNLTNMLWVEQPIGTGFAIGTATATNEEDVANQFLGFFENFEKMFGIKNMQIYVTGESYAGRYVPYISSAMIDKDNTTYFDLHGALVYDPCIGEYVTVQTQIPTYPWVQANQLNLNLNASTMAELEKMDQTCGYADYREKYMKFPAAGMQPPLYFNHTANASCDIYDMAQNAMVEINPCLNPYWAIQQCPILYDPLGFPTLVAYLPAGAEIYFDRADVKKAMHAPSITWSECAGPVFVGDGGPQDAGDLSPDPIQHVLPKVIEHTNRVLVANADQDMVIFTNGTLMSIQNMTWHGKMGFQTSPTAEIDVTLPDLLWAPTYAANGIAGLDGPGQGVMGIQHYERGLMWGQTYLSGHMQPQFQPRLSYRHLSWLLGLTEKI